MTVKKVLAIRTLFFVAAVTLSAFLVFSIQPIFGKLALPILGGSPNVWITVMLFFQTALLIGYSYAHLLYLLPVSRNRIWLHGLILVAATMTLPINLQPPDSYSANPVVWLLGAMAISVGPPFVLLSASAPLMQRFYAERSDHGGDPYFLYSASNLGSILALLSYPFIIERFLTTSQQSFLWSAGYGVLVLLLAGCVLVTKPFESPHSETLPTNPPFPRHAPFKSAPFRIEAQRLGMWVFLAALPSSLLLGTTTRITTDVASAPLLWVLPLVFYLLTYVIAFARRPILPHNRVCTAFPFIFISSVICIFLVRNVVGSVAAHLVLLFLSALMCHGELVRQRPEIRGLTLFFLCISIGGALGGFFNAIVAPLIFANTYEYPLALFLVCLCWPGIGEHRNLLRHWSSRPRGAVGLLAAIFVAMLVFSQLTNEGAVLAQKRNFYGILKVVEQPVEGETLHVMYHGTTVHGAQRAAGPQVCQPLLYYHPDGPVGDILKPGQKLAEEVEKILLVGLGAGALLGYAQAHQDWSVIDIDPSVIELALDQNLFSFINGCSKARNVQLMIGDGRIVLQRMAEPLFDLIVLDAYSSDAVPVHLATIEALALYRDALTQTGIILIHATNRYLALDKVFATQARELGLSALIKRKGKHGLLASSTWIAIAREPAALQSLAAADWGDLEAETGIRPWTDSYSEIISILK